MATIEQRTTQAGRTRYRVLVRLKGHPPESATFTRKTDAKRWAQDTESAIREGRYFKASRARKHTLEALLDRYEAEVVPTKSPRTAKVQQRHLEYWKEALGAYVLADVSPGAIASKRDELARGGKRAPATVNRYLAILSHAFTVAVREWEWIEHNPVRRVRRLKEARGRVRFLSEKERKSLLDACRTSPDRRVYPLVVIAISTGARQGELMSLRWKDVDLVRGSAVVHDTKNGERRALPLQGHAREIIAEFRKVRRVDSDLVFVGAEGLARFPRKPWLAAVAQAKIKDFRFHDLRHSAASYLAMNGATLAEIAEILGHKTLVMVKRYSHLSEQHTSNVVARMNDSIFS